MGPDQNDWRAILYGLILRNRGYATDEIAYLVVERYPHTAARLERLIASPKLQQTAATTDAETGEKRDEFGRLIGHEKAKTAGA